MALVGFSSKNILILFSLDFGILSPKQKQTECFARTLFEKKHLVPSFEGVIIPQ